MSAQMSINSSLKSIFLHYKEDIGSYLKIYMIMYIIQAFIIIVIIDDFLIKGFMLFEVFFRLKDCGNDDPGLII